MHSIKPWITYEAQAYLDSIEIDHCDVFEYGSGSSTIYFANRCKSVTAVEHNPAYYITLRKELDERELDNVRLLIETPELIQGDAIGYFVGSYESKEHAPGYNFLRYCTSIERTGQMFDFISIDGRARISCVQHAINRLRDGGVIMLDNSEREHYKAGIKLLRDFNRIDLQGAGDGGEWMTSFFTAK